MVFSSTIFIFIFLPALFFVYYLINDKYKNSALLIASLVFYSWGEPQNIFVVLFSILINYIFAIVIDRLEKYNIFILILSLIWNLGLLFVFKYLNFSVDILNSVFNDRIEIDNIILPIGISFFTFQIISYVVDVYRKRVKAQRNFMKLALYILLFPQLIAGPIVRYIDIERQIDNKDISLDRMYDGIIRFTLGFSKKVLIADQLSTYVDLAFGSGYPSVFTKWLGMIAYTLQIYYDFSGYSDMAIGLGKMLGFDFLENFNFPYVSQSIKEFWRRWHISLSSWFKDYVYIPLGGSRKGKIRTYIHILIVFFLTGLWHGASYNFIVWGLWYAFFLIIERLGLDKVLESLPKVIRHIYSITIIMLGWVWFRADGFAAALNYIKGLFVFSGNDMNNFLYLANRKYLLLIAVGILLSYPHELLYKTINIKVQRQLKGAAAIVLFIIAVCFLVGSGYSPFLYFRF